jgi:hypothetical protein
MGVCKIVEQGGADTTPLCNEINEISSFWIDVPAFLEYSGKVAMVGSSTLSEFPFSHCTVHCASNFFASLPLKVPIQDNPITPNW